MINGTMRRQSTYNIGRMLIDNIAGENDTVTELFLPEAMPHFCVGCAQCIMAGEDKCPHYDYVSKIEEKMNEADLMVFTTPVFVFHCSGQMKALLDHFGYRWMVHRPLESMFKKQAVVITTAAGGGMKSAARDISHSFTYWGVGKIYAYKKAVGAASWSDVSQKKRDIISVEIKSLSDKINKHSQNVKPSLFTRLFFTLMAKLHKKSYCQTDDLYWKRLGWTNGKKPWKS